MVKLNSKESKIIYGDVSDICNSKMTVAFKMIEDIEKGLYRITVDVHSELLPENRHVEAMNRLGDVMEMVEMVYSVKTDSSIKDGRYKIFLSFITGKRLIERKES